MEEIDKHYDFWDIFQESVEEERQWCLNTCGIW